MDNEKRLAELTRKSRQALDELGTTPEQVAQRLRATGTRGIPLQPQYCPVATYVQNSGVPGAVVFSRVEIDNLEDPETNGHVLVPHLDDDYPAVFEFMMRFDTDDYPDLKI